MYPAWDDREARQAAAVAAIELGMGWFIKINRQARGWSLGDLAEQCSIPEGLLKLYEEGDLSIHDMNLGTLVDIAEAFDVVLRVDFTTFQVLAESSQRLCEDDLTVQPFQPHQ
jgi:transcriptional regulator with XRE-family HTH domain